MGRGVAGVPSTCNLANAREARPIAREEQKVWFSGRGKRPSFGILPRLLLGDALLGKHTYQNGKEIDENRLMHVRE